MTLIARRRDTGEEVEVLALTLDDMAFVATPGSRGVGGRLVSRSLLDPDPHEVSLFEGFTSWTDQSMWAVKAEA